jgi:peroxiredoxin
MEMRLGRLQTGRHPRWTDPRVVIAADDLFANWADFPSIQASGNSTLVAHWLASSAQDTYADDVRLARSTDRGHQWQEMGTVHRGGTPTENGFVSMVAEHDGIRVFWLDGRQTAGAHHDDGTGPASPMTLRTTWIGNAIEPSQLLDDRVCEGCQTSAAMTADGPVIVYRDRSVDEVRDIAILRRTTAGWSAAALVHADGWNVGACPVNGPAVAAGGFDGRRLAVAWYTAANDRPRVQVAFSDDAGRSFGDPVLVDGSGPLGRVALLLDESGEAIVLWLAAGSGEQAEIRLRRVGTDTAGGAVLGESLTVAACSGSRDSGFPRLARQGQDLVVAWTDAGPPTQVRAGLLTLASLPRVATRRPGSDAAIGRSWDGTPGSMAPDYSARALDGTTTALSELRGRPVLLNFWATWCPPCRKEVLQLAALHTRHAAQGLEILGVSIDSAGADESVRVFVDREGVPYVVLRDPENRASRLFGLEVLPATFLFDGAGQLVWSHRGPVRAEDGDLLAALERSLGPVESSP